MAKTRKKPAKSRKLININLNMPTVLLALAAFSFVGSLVYVFVFASVNNRINPGDERNHVSRINNHRTSTHSPSRGSVDRTGCLTDIARYWSKHMANYGGIHHNQASWHQRYGSTDYLKDPRDGSKTSIKYHTHSSYGISKVDAYCGDNWTSFGENVGVGGSESSLFSAFLNSCGGEPCSTTTKSHHGNIHLDPHNFVGVGDFVDSDGFHWITQLFTACRTSSGAKCGGKYDREPSDSCAAPAPSDGLLSNGSFELPNHGYDKKWSEVRDTNTWYTWRSDGENIGRGNTAHGDCYSMFNRDIEAGSVSTTQIVRVSAGSSYTLSGWYKYSAHGGNQTIILDYLDSNFERIKDFREYTTHSTSWRETPKVTGTAPSGTYYARIILYGSAGDGASSNFYWDDIRLVKN